jgi:predicted transcriptional regulator
VKTVTIHLDKKLLEQCKSLAEQQNITLSQLVENAIKQLIKEVENGRQI